MRSGPPLEAVRDGSRRALAVTVALALVLSPVVASTSSLHADAAADRTSPSADRHAVDAPTSTTARWAPPAVGVDAAPPVAPDSLALAAPAAGGVNVTETLDATLDTSRSVLGVDIAVTPSGDYAVAGRSAVTNDADAFVARVARNGTVEWTRMFGSRGLDWFTGVVVTAGGDIVAVGSSRSRATPDAGESTDGYAVRLRGNGSVVWERAYGGDDADWLNDASVRNGVVTAVGSRTETNSGTGGKQLVRHGWFLRFDAGSGSVRTDRTYTHYGTERFFASKRLPGGGFAVTGSADPRVDTEVKRDIYVAGLDGDGDTRWTTTVGDRNEDIGYDVALVPSGDPVVVGWSDESEENRSDDAVFARVSPDGQGGAAVRWTTHVGTPATDVGHQVIRVGDRIVATTYPGTGTDDDRVARTYRVTPNGTVTSLGYTGDHEGQFFLGGLATGPSTFVLTGATSSVASDDDGPYDPFVTRLRLSGDGVDDGPSPTARFDYAPEDVSADVPVEFEANASDDGVVMVRRWRFGDGSIANGADVTHAFNSSGNYTVTLTVTDNTGRQDTVSKTIQVAPPPSEQFDRDGDGLEQDELRDALGNVTGADEALPGDNGTTTNGTDGGNGSVNVKEARVAIDEYISNASTDDPLAGAPNGTVDTDGDGLSDWLEKRGVPVLNTYNLSTVGDDTDLAPSLDTDAPDIERLDTDPLDSDTDDDGISDGKELGAKRVTSGPRGQQYYLLKADPTDINTDDTGVDDEEELKKGSDPTVPEALSVQVSVPTLATCRPSPDRLPSATGCVKTFDGEYVIRHTAEANSGGPAWLQSVDTSDDVDAAVYHLIVLGVKVHAVGGINPEQDLPRTIEFSLGGGVSGEIEASGAGSRDNIDPGGSIPLFAHSLTSADKPAGYDRVAKRRVYLVVKSTHANVAQHIGLLQVELGLPRNSIFLRQPRIDRRTDAFAFARYQSIEQFRVQNNVPGTSKREAKAMVRKSTRILGTRLAGAIIPTGAGLAGRVSGLTGQLIVDGTYFILGRWIPVKDPTDLLASAVAGDGAVPTYLKTSGQYNTTHVAVTYSRSN